MLALKTHPSCGRQHEVLFTVVEEVWILCVIPTGPSGVLVCQMTYSQQEYQKVSRREKNVVIRQNGSNGKKLLRRKLDAIPICVCKVTDILCVIVLSSEPHTRTCPSACLRTELPISVLFPFFSSFGVLLVPASPNTFLLNVPNL